MELHASPFDKFFALLSLGKRGEIVKIQKDRLFNSSNIIRFFAYALSLTGDRKKAFLLLKMGISNFHLKNAKDAPTFVMFFLRHLRSEFLARFYQPGHSKLPYPTDTIISLDQNPLELAKIDQEKLPRYLKVLNSIEREILFFWAVEGLSLGETSAAIGIPKGMILSKLNRMKSKLDGLEQQHQELQCQ